MLTMKLVEEITGSDFLKNGLIWDMNKRKAELVKSIDEVLKALCDVDLDAQIHQDTIEYLKDAIKFTWKTSCIYGELANLITQKDANA